MHNKKSAKCSEELYSWKLNHELTDYIWCLPTSVTLRFFGLCFVNSQYFLVIIYLYALNGLSLISKTLWQSREEISSS